MSRHRDLRNLHKDYSDYDDGYDDDYWAEEEWAPTAKANPAPAPSAPAPAPAPSSTAPPAAVTECVGAIASVLGEQYSAAEMYAAATLHSGNVELAIDALLTSQTAPPAGVGPPGLAPQLPQPEDHERRYDADGVLYTMAEFVQEYGGTAEWARAARQVTQPEEEEEEERRCDPNDGALYTKAEFVAEYGGTAEWARAAPRRQPTGEAGAQLARDAGQKLSLAPPSSSSVPHPAAAAPPPKAAPPAAAGRRARGKAAKEASGGGPAAAAAPSAAAPAAPLPPAEAPPPSEQLNMVVIGHVDAGKSTLMGRLLLMAGEVDERTMQRYEKEARALNKGSFRYAWVMDQDAEERARGVTIDVGCAFFRTPRRLVNVLDAPGHQDFVPNMIGGAAQADAALLVLNASTGAFEAGLCAQTREHLLLARSLGVSQLLVAVNQMDSVAWSQSRYDEIVAQIGPIAQQSGFARQPTCVPVSALGGLNLGPTCPPPAEAAGWVMGRSLLDEIDELQPQPHGSTAGLRLCVADVVHGTRLGPVAVSGTLQSGTLRPGQKLLLLPGAEAVHVKAVHSRGVAVTLATAGDHVEVGLVGCAADSSIAQGSVLCDPQRPAHLARQVEVRLRVFGVQVPLTRGQPLEAYCHASSGSATLRKIVAGLDEHGQPTAIKPRCLRAHTSALVLIEFERPVCVQLHAECKPMGRLVLREAGATLTAGVITRIHEAA